MSSFSNEVRASHLDWSNKQKRILTGGDRADELYTADRGYPFEQSELPHYLLIRNETHAVFDDWKQKKCSPSDDATKEESRSNNDDRNITHYATLVGAWKRLIFFGGWEHTTIEDERTYNLQSRGLFIDLRIPNTREAVLSLPSDKTSLSELSKDELRCYARQHIFAGYTQVKSSDDAHHQKDLLCTRHHCIDWNFVGTPRSRPNKWYAETKAEKCDDEVKTWKEWAFAKDERGQHYYCEQWERLPMGKATPMLALRKKQCNNATDRDGIILVVGDHFSYVLSRDLSNLSEDKLKEFESHSALNVSTVGLVDAALDQDDLATARTLLSIQGGHGLISKGWLVDCAIEPWMEGKKFCSATEDPITISWTTYGGEEINNCQVVWKGHVFEVFDTSLKTVEELTLLLQATQIGIS